MAYFPMFADIENEPCLVAGGGRIALRKVKMLLEFGAHVIVAAPEIREDLAALVVTAGGEVKRREALESDCDGMTLVISATDDENLNSRLSVYCKARHIFINVVDRKEKCSFILPSYIKQQNVVAAFSSSGYSPALTQYLKAKEQDILTPYIGEVNELLGLVRRPVQECFETEEERKEVFLKIMNKALEEGELPSEEWISDLLK